MAGEMMISLISIVIAVLAFVNAFSFPGGTSDGVPGAGVFPQALCGIIIVINLLLIYFAWKNKKPREPMTAEHKEGLKRMGLIVAATAAMIAVWGNIHFILLCSIYLILIGLILKQNMKAFVPGAVVSSALLYFIFRQLLNVMI